MPVSPAALRPLRRTRILSLALNLPGPAALMRCRAMGARCTKLEPPANAQGHSADPMWVYSPPAYEALHAGLRVVRADLKTERGQNILHAELAKTDILITSFRPSALDKLGLQWRTLHKRYPQLGMVRIVGCAGARAEEPGHDLTYQAEQGLVTGLHLPPSLFADMGGALATSEAVLQVRMQQLHSGRGVQTEVALSDATAFLALPRAWGLMNASRPTGGSHVGYQVYACKDGRVALAALEPHFFGYLASAIGLEATPQAMFQAETGRAIAAFLAGKTRRQLDTLARTRDIPLVTLPR